MLQPRSGAGRLYFSMGSIPKEGAKMVRQDWSDDDLAQRLRERDHEALETLISRYSREMLYFIRMVLE